MQAGDSILDTVIANDVVRCGVRDDLPGFNILDEAGEHVGFDADFCRVIAAAVLGDATKVEFVDVETDARFTALQSGEIDVLVRNTTWTASRDGTEGVTFLHPTFYDGQGMMVAADSGFASHRRHGRRRRLRRRRDDDRGQRRHRVRAARPRRRGAVVRGRRDAADQLRTGWMRRLVERLPASSSASARPTRTGPEALVIFDEIFSKEPLAPAVVDGDSAWAQAVNWAIFATIQAEEWGITGDNVADCRPNSEDPNIRQFLGGENADGTVLDPGLGLDPAFAFNVVDQVGNYGEIFEAQPRPARHRARRQRPVDRRRPAVRPALPLTASADGGGHGSPS